MTKEEYQEYLRSAHWKQIKLWARSELNAHKCGVCGWTDKQATFHLHHLSYVRLHGEELHDLVFLCCYCHKLVHDLLSLKTGEYNPAGIVNRLKRERRTGQIDQYMLNKERKIFSTRKENRRLYYQRPDRRG